jgi:hypothetical protein
MRRILACIPFFLPRSRLLSVMWRTPNRANPDAIDIDRRTLWRERVASPLSARQFALMHALFERPDAILSRAQLADRIYGWGNEVQSNARRALSFDAQALRCALIRNVRDEVECDLSYKERLFCLHRSAARYDGHTLQTVMYVANRVLANLSINAIRPMRIAMSARHRRLPTEPRSVYDR